MLEVNGRCESVYMAHVTPVEREPLNVAEDRCCLVLINIGEGGGVFECPHAVWSCWR